MLSNQKILGFLFHGVRQRSLALGDVTFILGNSRPTGGVYINPLPATKDKTELNSGVVNVNINNQYYEQYASLSYLLVVTTKRCQNI